jgi:hypothetical protein
LNRAVICVVARTGAKSSVLFNGIEFLMTPRTKAFMCRFPSTFWHFYFASLSGRKPHVVHLIFPSGKRFRYPRPHAGQICFAVTIHITLNFGNVKGQEAIMETLTVFAGRSQTCILLAHDFDVNLQLAFRQKACQFAFSKSF